MTKQKVQVTTQSTERPPRQADTEVDADPPRVEAGLSRRSFLRAAGSSALAAVIRPPAERSSRGDQTEEGQGRRTNRVPDVIQRAISRQVANHAIDIILPPIDTIDLDVAKEGTSTHPGPEDFIPTVEPQVFHAEAVNLTESHT